MAGLAFFAGSQVRWGGPPRQVPAAEPGLAARARGILAQALAQSEIARWEQASRLFLRLHELVPDDSTAVINLAIVAYRAGKFEAAGRWLGQVDAEGDRRLEARIEFYRGKLSDERDSPDQALEALRNAVRLDPDEPVYAFALAQQYRRMRPLRIGPLVESLEKAFELWPENARIAVEFALWALASSEPETRRRGLAALEPLVASSENAVVKAHFDQGRKQALEPKAAGTTAPRRIRIACNLLRATGRYRRDAAVLKSRLRGTPLRRLGSWKLRRRHAFAEPLLRLEPARLLPAVPLEPGEHIVRIGLLDDAVERSPVRLVVLSTRAIHAWVPGLEDPWERIPIPSAKPPRALRTGDLDGDGLMEIVILAEEGLLVVDRGDTGWQASSVRGAGPFRDAVLVDFDHDGDLDLLALNDSGHLRLFLNRGQEGLDAGVPLELETEGGWTRVISVDLDGDADQDLILSGSGRVDVFSNERQGKFVHRGRSTVPGSPTQLVAYDYSGDGHTDLVLLSNREIEFLVNRGHGSLQQDPTARGCAAPLARVLQPTRLRATDLDLDGDLDLLVSGRPTSNRAAAIVALENRGRGYFLFEPGILDERLSDATALLTCDLDGDGDPDVVSQSADTLTAFRSVGAEHANRIALHLRAPKGKVPLDAKGVRLAVHAGDAVHFRQIDRPNVVLGLGSRTADLVKATWPNGISEYLFDPAPNRDHTITLVLRLEGSCPFLYARDGDSFRFVTDALGLSPLGMQIAPGVYATPDPEEYLRLPAWVEPSGSRLELRLTEELREVTYLDQVELVAVDAPAGIQVFNGEQWAQRPVQGLALRLLGRLHAPAWVRDATGRDVLNIVAREDQRYLTGFRQRSRYQGTVALHHLTLGVPTELIGNAPFAMVLTGWLHWGNTSTNVARAQDRLQPSVFPYLEVPDGPGGWRSAGPAGLPAGKTKPVVVIPQRRPDASDARIRLTTNAEVYWDRIAFARLLSPQSTEHRIHRLALGEAALGFGGFSRWHRDAPNGPYVFDYTERRAYPWRRDRHGREVALSWSELEGYYTSYGPVTAFLQAPDDQLVVFGSGEEIALSFDTGKLPSLPPGWHRTYFLHLEGWEKDGDFNVADSTTVAPLPFRAMAGDPSRAQATPGNDDPTQLRTRWVNRDRLTRRVQASRRARKGGGRR